MGGMLKDWRQTGALGTPGGAAVSRHRPASLPSALRPMLAALAPEPFDSSDHIFELKWGGVRALAYVRGGRPRLQGRNLRDLTPLFPELNCLPRQLHGRDLVLDGEVMALGPEGHPDAEALASRLTRCALSERPRPPSGARVSYQAYDLLFLNGRPLLNRPLVERRALLQDVLEASPSAQAADFIEHDGVAFFEAAAEHKLEGIVAKEKQSLYFPGKRSPAWLEVRAIQSGEFVIGGYTFGGATSAAGRRDSFQGLLLGAYRGGRLHYVGQATGGYSRDEGRALAEHLSRMHVAEPPFVDAPALQRFVFWVRPDMVCQVRFSEWGPDGRLRFPIFAALRPDLSPQECAVDDTAPAPP